MNNLICKPIDCFSCECNYLSHVQKWVIKWEIIFFVKRALSFMIRNAPVYNMKQLYLIQWCETFQPLLEHLVSSHNASLCIYVRVCVLVSKIKALQPGQWVHVLLKTPVSPWNPGNVTTYWQSLQSALSAMTQRDCPLTVAMGQCTECSQGTNTASPLCQW